MQRMRCRYLVSYRIHHYIQRMCAHCAYGLLIGDAWYTDMRCWLLRHSGVHCSKHIQRLHSVRRGHHEEHRGEWCMQCMRCRYLVSCRIHHCIQRMCAHCAYGLLIGDAWYTDMRGRLR